MKFGIILFVLSVAISIVLLNPSVKSKTMSWLLSTDKKVLSKMEMKVNGTVYKVVKIKNLRGLAVELYKLEDQELIFLDTKQLTDKKDAFYKFDDGKYNLFLKDINEDGVEDIILPSLDKNMKARLNVYSLDVTNEVLTRQTSH